MQHMHAASPRAGKILLIAVLALLGLALLVGLLLWRGYNGLATGRENVAGRWAEIDNQYKRRADLVPQLVAVVKGAADFEQTTLQNVVEARASVGRVQLPPGVPEDPQQLAAYLQAQQQLSGALSRLLVVAEQYPQLKASQNFLSLQDQLEGTENRIAVARRDYIEAVQAFNTRTVTFPGNLIAGLFGFQKVPQLEAATSEERQVPAVQFDFGGGKAK